MKEGEKVLEVEPGHANEAVEKPDANAKDDEMKVRKLAVALKPATVKENEVAEDPEADIKITDGEKSVEMEPTSASVKVNDEAVEKADGKAKNNEMKAREAAVALEPASVKENEVVEHPEADIKIKLDIVDPKTNKCFNITNGKVVIVGDGIATKGVLEFSLVRVDTPAFAACTMSSESTRETRKSKKYSRGSLNLADHFVRNEDHYHLSVNLQFLPLSKWMQLLQALYHHFLTRLLEKIAWSGALQGGKSRFKV